jgi:ribosomal protein L7Ae-like RNA K-turn-binding protein
MSFDNTYFYALNMLGLAMRAGKLITGEEMTINEIRKRKVNLVIPITFLGLPIAPKISP